LAFQPPTMVSTPITTERSDSQISSIFLVERSSSDCSKSLMKDYMNCSRMLTVLLTLACLFRAESSSQFCSRRISERVNCVSSYATSEAEAPDFCDLLIRGEPKPSAGLFSRLLKARFSGRAQCLHLRGERNLAERSCEGPWRNGYRLSNSWRSLDLLLAARLLSVSDVRPELLQHLSVLLTGLVLVQKLKLVLVGELEMREK